jgi:hypothetical protein
MNDEKNRRMDRNLRGDSLTVAMNKRIHALVKPGEEWHRHKAGNPYCCFKTNDPDYFSPELHDSLRVAMVTAAVEKFGEMTLCAEVLRIALGPTQEVYETLNASLLALPAPAIAEAIDRLILEERK